MLQDPVTNIIELLTQLRKEGISLWEENGKLRYRAPQGILQDNDLQALRDHKSGLLELLETEAKAMKVVPDPESRFKPFPLTDIQSAYLLGRHDAFGYGGVACHIYMELNYFELDPERAEAVWNQLVSRHGMLRAIINHDGHQQILKSVPSVDISYIDASNWEEQKIESTLSEIREEMGYRLYDTERWPLFGIAITELSNAAIMHFSMDFLIADWASIWKLLSEFETLYEEPQTQLAMLDLSFRDYLLAERSLRETPVYHSDKEYWFRRVDALPLAPDLPLASRCQKDTETARFRRRFLQLDKPAWDKMTQYAQKRSLTPTVVVMTAYAAVIGEWSRNKTFTLNLTVLNRLGLHPQVNDIVGDFTTINLLSVDLHGEKSFTEHAQALSRQLFKDLEHRSFSGVEVLREITRRRGREAALMPIVFTSAIGLTKSNQLKGKFKGHGISQTPQVFIDCQAMDGSEGLQVNWDVRQGVFPEQMEDDMFDAFEKLLRFLSKTEKTWESNKVVSLPEWQQLERNKINSINMPVKEELLHRKILEQAAADPDRPAVFVGDKAITYREVVQKAAAIAKKLKELNCAAQERVAIVIGNGVRQVEAVLGVLSAGAVYVPIDAEQPELRRLKMLEQAQITIVLTTCATQILWPKNIKTIEVDKIMPLGENMPVAEGDPSLPAYVMYTSGSTGEPKGVVISHRAAFNTVADINRRFNINQDDRVLGLARLDFDLSVYDIFGLLSAGGALVYPRSERRSDPFHWAKLIAEHNVTVWNSVPALMQMLLAYLNTEPKMTLSTLRLILLSGDWIPLSMPDMARKYLPPDAQIISLGGATEASIWSIYHICEGLKPEWQSIPYGRPLVNQGFRILDSQMHDCPVWVPGELYITGQGLAEGYLNDTKNTRERFFQHPADGQQLYRTGDLGRYLPNGEIEFLGREDNQVKINGHRIELGEIESALLKHPAVATAVVVITVSNENKVLLGFIKINSNFSVKASELVNYISQYLPAYMIPSKIQIIDTLPLTQNGKIDRHKLVTLRPDVIVEKATIEEKGSNKLEAELADLWAEALDIPSIGISENVYDHGADSLLMAQMSGKVREKLAENPLQEEIPFDALLQQMLNTPTVSALAEFILTYSQKPELTSKKLKPTNKKTQLSSDKTKLSPDNLSKKTSNALIIPYEGGQTGPLRVVFHAALGTMNYFRLLLSNLKRQNLGPVIGIAVADPEQYCRSEPSELIEQLADDYTMRISENSPKQIQLIGYSLGGLIAVEVARRLLEKGVPLTDLVLIDSFPSLFEIEDDLIEEALFLEHFHITIDQIGYERVNRNALYRGAVQLFERNNNCIPKAASITIGGDEELDKIGKLFQHLSDINRKERFTTYTDIISKNTDEQIPVEVLETLFKVFHQSIKAARFRPRPFVGNIRFLAARDQHFFISGLEQDVFEFWSETCLGNLEVIKIDGNHMTCIEEEQQAYQVAELIAAPLYL